MLTVPVGVIAMTSPVLARARESRFVGDPSQAMLAVVIGMVTLVFVTVLLPSWVVALRLPGAGHEDG